MDDALLFFEDLKPCGLPFLQGQDSRAHEARIVSYTSSRLVVRLVPLGYPSLDRIATDD